MKSNDEKSQIQYKIKLTILIHNCMKSNDK